MFCLTKEYADKFKNALIDGSITPDTLFKMTSEERRNYLGKFVGNWNAKGVNTLFEGKLLLKNQQAGMITWAKKVSGLNETQKATILDKIEKLDKALTPENESAFLADIVEQRLKVNITPEEARTITTLTKQAKDSFDPNKKNWEQSKEYWQTRQKLVQFLREETSNIQKTGAVSDTISVLRSIKTGFDLSAPLRQGRALLGTKEFNGAFYRMFEYAKSQSALDALEVDMMSHKYSEFALQNKRELGLTLLGEKFTQREEQFASKLIEKIPLLRGSERAFTGFLNDLRFNRFVNILENLDKADRGITENPTAMKDLAKVIGASTGRGTLGSAEGAARSLATVMFSPRWMASRMQLILNPLTKSGPARVEAIKSLARISGTSVAILGMAKMAGADVEIDSRSSDFGKIKIGNTRFDVTGGIAPYITALSRIGTFSTKSSTTGLIRKLNTGEYGSQTALGVLTGFIENKTSPVGSVVKDVLKGENFEGEKIEINPKSLQSNKDLGKYLIDQLITPLLGSDAYDAFTDASGNAIVGVAATIGSLFGVGVQTYSADTDWNQNLGKELLQFKERVGDAKFTEANDRYNKKFNDKIQELKNNPEYQKLPDDEKAIVLAEARDNIKSRIFGDYGFKYKQEKSKQTNYRKFTQ